MLFVEWIFQSAKHLISWCLNENLWEISGHVWELWKVGRMSWYVIGYWWDLMDMTTTWKNKASEWASERVSEWLGWFSLCYILMLCFLGTRLSRKKSCKVLNEDLIPLHSCDSCRYPYLLPLTTCAQIISLSEILCPDLSSHNVFLLHTKVHHPLAPHNSPKGCLPDRMDAVSVSWSP